MSARVCGVVRSVDDDPYYTNGMGSVNGARSAIATRLNPPVTVRRELLSAPSEVDTDRCWSVARDGTKSSLPPGKVETPGRYGKQTRTKLEFEWIRNNGLLQHRVSKKRALEFNGT
jgi:hypothetical protein